MTINLDNKSYNAWWGLGNVFYKQEKYDKAIECFNYSAKINPNNPVLHTFIAMSFAAKNEHYDSLKHFNSSE
jgi:anaphase-promoting complex subunit 3